MIVLVVTLIVVAVLLALVAVVVRRRAALGGTLQRSMLQAAAHEVGVVPIGGDGPVTDVDLGKPEEPAPGAAAPGDQAVPA